MFHKLLWRIPLFSIACVGTTSPAVAQDIEVAKSEVYEHEGTGLEFPDVLPGFKRNRISDYNSDGSSVIIRYQKIGMNGQMRFTINSVGHIPCEKEFEGKKSVMIGKNGSASDLNFDFKVNAFNGVTQLSTRIEIPRNGYGFRHGAMVTDLWMACIPNSQWRISYIGTFNADEFDRKGDIAASLFEGIDWSSILVEK